MHCNGRAVFSTPPFVVRQGMSEVSLMAEQDQAARYAAKRLNPAAYLRELMGEAFWQVWRWRGWQDSQTIAFPGEGDRRLDTLAWFDRPDGKSPPPAVAIEFLAHARADVLPRMAEYTLRVHRELPYQEPDEAAKEEAAAPQIGNLGLMLTVGVRNLETMSAQGLLNRVTDGASRALLAFLPLYAGADEEQMAKGWAALVADEKDERMRADLVALARVFAAHAGRMKVWGPVLEGVKVAGSPWLEEIRTEGRLQMARADVVDVLEARFPGAVPSEVIEAIQSEGDLPLLKQILRLAAVQSPAEVRDFLRQSGQ